MDFFVGEQLTRTFHDRACQIGQNDAVATDIPARLQSDTGMDLADGAYGFSIFRIGAAFDNRLPVALLGGVGRLDVGFVAEEAHGLRLFTRTVIKRIKRLGQCAFDNRPHSAVAGRRSGQTHEIHTVFQR